MALCNPTTESKIRWQEDQNKIWDLWLAQDKIMERFTTNGKMSPEEAKVAADNLKWFLEQKLDLPYTPDSPMEKATVKRINLEIKDFNSALKGNFSNLPFIVPEGTSKQDPVARRFYLKLNEILNYERINVNKMLEGNAKISNYLFEAYMDMSGKSRGLFGRNVRKAGSTAINKMRDIRRKMLDPQADEKVHAEFVNEMEKFVKNDADGVTIRDFTELIHLDKNTFKSANPARGKKYIDRQERLANGDQNPNYGKETIYNPNVYKSVVEARKLLDEMGGVYLTSLNSLKQVVRLKYGGDKNAKIIPADGQRIVDAIENSMDSIKSGIELGGYFPHIQVESIVNLKEAMSKALDSNVTNRNNMFGNIVDNILAPIGRDTLPHHARGKNQLLDNYWQTDPLMVISEYSNQATQFNKMIHTQINYLEAMRNLPKTNTQFVKGMKRFINEEYTVFTRGTSGRPEWANNAVMTLNALQTARTMGLNITGAIKNAASALHFYSRIGFKAAKDARHAVEHDSTFKKFLAKAEEEAGFLFTDAAKELYSEGLITSDQLKQSKVEFNPLTGKITVDNTPIFDAFKSGLDWTLDKALIFHRLTENHQRKWMYRTALHQKYAELTGKGVTTKEAEKFSKEFALKMVNAWAYEYAAHAKAKIVRGEGRVIEEIGDGVIVRKGGEAGALSEITFHLMHYPMSLMESHYSQLKGAYKALKSGQNLDSQELQYVLRYAGVATMIALSSIVTNANLFNILENETQERLFRVVTDITEADNPDRGTFGLLSEFTGPTIGTLKYALIAQGIIDIDHSTLNKILFGNVDFADEGDKHAELYRAYQYSTEWGVLKNKIIPTLRAGRGRDLFTHFLKLYPSKWTREGHKMLPWSTKTKKRNRKRDNEIASAIKVLDSMRN